MKTHLTYRDRIICIEPMIVKSRLVFRIYVNTIRIVDVRCYTAAKRMAAQFIDGIAPDLCPPNLRV